MENLEWLRDELGEYENDYIIIDCPGVCFFDENPASLALPAFLCEEQPMACGIALCGLAVVHRGDAVRDAPFAGQIELYSHFTYMRQLVDTLQQWDYRVCGVSRLAIKKLVLVNRGCLLFIVYLVF
jgi:hypothetical protein